MPIQNARGSLVQNHRNAESNGQVRIRHRGTRWVWLIALGLGLTKTSYGQAGRDWGIERTEYVDPVTHVKIHELTDKNSKADNLYFHFSNFTADNRSVLFVSDRTGSAQLFRADVATGRITQLTDGDKLGARSACPNPRRAEEVYIVRGSELTVLNIETFSVRLVGTVPQPMVGGPSQPSPSHDGKWLAISKQRDAANWEIGLVSTETGEYRTVTTQGFRIGHLQHSPTDPLLFYVWETGGYAPQRTWLVNADGTGNRPFYYRAAQTNWFTPLKEWVTHEAWISGTGEMTMVNDKLGVMVVNKEGHSRMVREGNYWHAAADPEGKQLVLDDMQGRLWLSDVKTGSVRLLATGIRATERVHAHASFDRLGHYIQFHSGRSHETIALIDLRTLPAER